MPTPPTSLLIGLLLCDRSPSRRSRTPTPPACSCISTSNLYACRIWPLCFLYALLETSITSSIRDTGLLLRDGSSGWRSSCSYQYCHPEILGGHQTSSELPQISSVFRPLNTGASVGGRQKPGSLYPGWAPTSATGGDFDSTFQRPSSLASTENSIVHEYQ